MDYIYIIKDNNEMEKMEVVTIYNVSNSDYNYIIYKSLDDNDNYYVGKYMGDAVNELVTDLSDEERNYAQGVYEALVGEK